MQNINQRQNIMQGTSRKKSSPFKLLGKSRIIRHLDNVQDALVVILCIALLIVMVLLLLNLFLTLQVQPDFKQITSDMLFLLILVELFRLLMVYLDGHHISVRVAIEVTMVSVLREVIVEGIIHLTWIQTLSICAFILAASALLYIDAITKGNELSEGHGDKH